MRPTPALLATLLPAALALAACGGGTTRSGARSAPASPLAPATGALAAQRCSEAVRAETALPAAARRRLEAVCAQAAAGGPAAVRRAAQGVCEELIGRSSLPSGTAREQALEACRRP